MRGDYDHGRECVIVLFDMRTEFISADAAKIDVDQIDVRSMVWCLKKYFRIGKNDDGVALAKQKIFQQFAGINVVIDDSNNRHL